MLYFTKKKLVKSLTEKTNERMGSDHTVQIIRIEYQHAIFCTCNYDYIAKVTARRYSRLITQGINLSINSSLYGHDRDIREMPDVGQIR